MASKLVKPKATTDPATGRITYEGSLSQRHTELTADQKRVIDKELKTAPRMASELVALTPGMSSYDPFCAESIRRYLAELEKGGHVQQMKDARGKLLGWQSTPEPAKEEKSE